MRAECPAMKNLLYGSGNEKLTKGYYGICMNFSSEWLFTGRKIIMIVTIGEMTKHVESKSEDN